MKPTEAMPHPPEWNTTTVGESVDIQRGVSWSKEQEHQSPREGAVPVIGIRNVQEQLELDDLLYLSGIKPSVVAKKRVTAGWSVIVGSNGNRNRVGNAVLARREDSEFMFASFLIGARPKSTSSILPPFFYRWLASEPIQAYLSASSEGSTGLNNLSHSFFRSMKLAYPEPPEQVAITSILDVVDKAIERVRVSADRSRETKRALLQHLYSHGTRKQKQKKTSIGAIPESWTVRELNSVVNEFQYGLSVAMQTTGTLPILRMGNIQAGNVLLTGLKYVRLPERLTAPYLLKRGDVLFNRTNSQELVGKVGIYRSDGPSVFASYLIRLKDDPELVDNYYLGQLLDSYDAQCRIKRYATPGVQQVNINATNLGRVLIPLPPPGKDGLEEQKEIAMILEQADETIRAFGPKLSALRELKRTLMHDLLTGRVRVNNSNPQALAVA
jgi:type I restriction enzyme S subunit